MDIKLKSITRQNWEDAIALQVEKGQQGFVPSVAVSLAKTYVKPDGDHITYVPFAIYNKEKMVGFVMHAYEPGSTNMYWINGFLIDSAYQGKGYGKVAILALIKWIRTSFPLCEEIRLTVYDDNQKATRLYKSIGFQETEHYYDDERVWFYRVT